MLCMLKGSTNMQSWEWPSVFGLMLDWMQKFYWSNSLNVISGNRYLSHLNRYDTNAWYLGTSIQLYQFSVFLCVNEVKKMLIYYYY